MYVSFVAIFHNLIRSSIPKNSSLREKMAEKLRNKYSEILKERNFTLNELKRVRHDYDYYVKQTDQVIN